MLGTTLKVGQHQIVILRVKGAGDLIRSRGDVRGRIALGDEFLEFALDLFQALRSEGLGIPLGDCGFACRARSQNPTYCHCRLAPFLIVSRVSCIGPLECGGGQGGTCGVSGVLHTPHLRWCGQNSVVSSLLMTENTIPLGTLEERPDARQQLKRVRWVFGAGEWAYYTEAGADYVIADKL